MTASDDRAFLARVRAAINGEGRSLRALSDALDSYDHSHKAYDATYVVRRSTRGLYFARNSSKISRTGRPSTARWSPRRPRDEPLAHGCVVTFRSAICLLRWCESPRRCTCRQALPQDGCLAKPARPGRGDRAGPGCWRRALRSSHCHHVVSPRRECSLPLA